MTSDDSLIRCFAAYLPYFRAEPSSLSPRSGKFWAFRLRTLTGQYYDKCGPQAPKVILADLLDWYCARSNHSIKKIRHRPCLDISTCKTRCGDIRRAWDRPKQPKWAHTAPRGACPSAGRFSLSFEKKFPNRLALSSTTYYRIVPSSISSVPTFTLLGGV